MVEAQAPSPQLLAKHTVLLAQIIDHQQLALVHPPGERDQQDGKDTKLWACGQTNYREPRRLPSQKFPRWKQIRFSDHTGFSGWPQKPPSKRAHVPGREQSW